MLYEEKTIETIPVGPLGLIPLKSCTELGAKVNDYLVDWRRERESEHKSTIAFSIRESPISLGPAHRVSVLERRRERFPSQFVETIYTSWWMYAITA